MKPFLPSLPHRPSFILTLGLVGSLASFALGLTLGISKIPNTRNRPAIRNRRTHFRNHPRDKKISPEEGQKQLKYATEAPNLPTKNPSEPD